MDPISCNEVYSQAEKGEKIEAVGFIEEDKDGVRRLLVGTSREAEEEYIRIVA